MTRVGIVGCGNVTTGLHLPLLLNIKGVEVVYAADIDRRAEAAQSYGVKWLTIGKDISNLPDCDVLLLAIPVGVREAYIREFGSRNTSIFSEKTFALSTDQHKRFLQLAKKMGCNYARITQSATRQLARLIQFGPFGRLLHVSMSEGGIVGATGKSKNHYQTSPELSGGGILIELGCHPISQLAFLFDGYEFSVERAEIQKVGGIDVDVEARLVASKGGDSVPIDFRLSMVRPLEIKSRFVFENAEVVFDHRNPDGKVQISGKWQGQFTLEPDRSWALTIRQEFYLKWKNFLSSVQEENAFDAQSPSETSLATTKMIADIYGRAANG